MSKDKSQRIQKSVDELSLMSDTLFQKAADDQPRFVQEIIQPILNIPGLRVISAKAQKNIVSLERRSVRLDAIAEDTLHTRPCTENGAGPCCIL